MGATFSTIQIKNPAQVTREQFANLLSGYFEKKGLIPTTEEDAQITYWIAFNEDNSWATLGSGGYDLGAANKDVPEIAKELKTHCILSSVWSSDFLEIKLFGSSPIQNDKIGVGQSYDDAKISKGNPELWEPLLVNGRTWEEVKELCDKDYTFAEDALFDLAPLFGINPLNVTLSYNCTEIVSSDSPNIVDLYFKQVQPTFGKVVDITQYRASAQQLPKKPRPLNTVFKQVFGEALAPLGFVKIKGRHPYLARMVGDEIVQIVTIMDKQTGEINKSGFSILFGVATVYRLKIDLSISPWYNSIWLRSLSDIYYRLNRLTFNNNRRIELMYSTYHKDNEENLIKELNNSLDSAREYALPQFNKIVDIDSCVDYFDTMGLHSSIYEYKNGFDTQNENYYEGLIYIILNNRKKYIDTREKGYELSIASEFKAVKEGRNGRRWEEIQEKQKKFIENKPERIEYYNKIFDDTEWLKRASIELEKRKAMNSKILRSYGLNI